MPIRTEALVRGGIYHVFNKTLDKLNVFENNNNAYSFTQRLKYYRSVKAKVSFSKLKNSNQDFQRKMWNDVFFKKYFKVEILVYCLMPNHFHFLLKQITGNGVTKFMSDILNSFTRYFNLKYERKGPAFLTQFKARAIKNEQVLIHVSRYIHLNPYLSGLVREPPDLKYYQFSSFKEYVYKTRSSLSETNLILSLFHYNRKRYKDFVLNQAEHQKTLEYAKHAEKWR